MTLTGPADCRWIFVNEGDTRSMIHPRRLLDLADRNRAFRPELDELVEAGAIRPDTVEVPHHQGKINS